MGKKKALILILTLLAVVPAAIAFFQAPEEETAWVCPMHTDYTMDINGTCPRCGMALVRAAPFDVRDYRLDLQTVPALVKAGQKTMLRLKISHPSSGSIIQKFETVHERQYHLFVISQDMELLRAHPS